MTIVVPCGGGRTSEGILLRAAGGLAGPAPLRDAAERTDSRFPSLQAVSVVVINFNGGEFLADCLERILAQTHPAAEIIVVDNRSTDGSPATILERFPDVRLIESTRNTGY